MEKHHTEAEHNCTLGHETGCIGPTMHTEQDRRQKNTHGGEHADIHTAASEQLGVVLYFEIVWAHVYTHHTQQLVRPMHTACEHLHALARFLNVLCGMGLLYAMCVQTA